MPFILTDEIIKGFCEGLLTEMILIDHQKAFKTINHEILFKKFKPLTSLKESLHGFSHYILK